MELQKILLRHQQAEIAVKGDNGRDAEFVRLMASLYQELTPLERYWRVWLVTIEIEERGK